MDTFHAINRWRSVKGFDRTRRFTAVEETKNLDAAIQSPKRSWRNAAPEIQKLATVWMGPLDEVVLVHRRRSWPRVDWGQIKPPPPPP